MPPDGGYFLSPNFHFVYVLLDLIKRTSDHSAGVAEPFRMIVQKPSWRQTGLTIVGKGQSGTVST